MINFQALTTTIAFSEIRNSACENVTEKEENGKKRLGESYQAPAGTRRTGLSFPDEYAVDSSGGKHDH